MAGTLRSRKRRDISSIADEVSADSFPTVSHTLDMDSPSSDMEIYAKEVLNNLIADNIPPTPSNFSLYFDRLLENKSESLRKQVVSILELEENNEEENTIVLEQNLKKGFGSVKTILSSTANIYKNMTLMIKILQKRQAELSKQKELSAAKEVLDTLKGDISKLSSILKTQSTHMKSIYDETAEIVKSVENETIFDNQFGVYNKRYLLSKIDKEIVQINEFKHKSSLILLELSRDLRRTVKNEKATLLMTRTLARLLLKTSRRSDIVAHYGNGVFAMLLKHTDIPSAEKASERLCDLVSNSNFFLADREIQLKIAIGVTDITPIHSVEEIIVSAMDGIEDAYSDATHDYVISLRTF